MRTARLDDLVWQLVVTLLSEPERLKREYERRLDIIEDKDKEGTDTAAFEKQKRHLQQAKSRLIDSYAEGMIEKSDFDPKIQQIKYRLQQLDIQIEASKRHHMGQSELFLIISRLDEFAAAVNGQLATTDFTLQREIIRALVKRIEIYKEEIVIVFRVDPDPRCNAGQKATDSVGGGLRKV